jgi:hypothetical protein
MEESSEIREHYQSLPDATLLDLAINGINDLREEYVPVLISVLKDRGLYSDSVREIIRDDQEEFKQREEIRMHVDSLEPDDLEEEEGIKEQEFARILEQFRQARCPICKRASGLNALYLKFTVGIVFFSLKHKKLVIGCPECLRKEFIQNQVWTLLLGFWSVPGLILTPLYLLGNFVDYNGMIKEHNAPTKYLIDYVRKNLKWIKIGKILV